MWSGVTGRENTVERDVCDLVKSRIIGAVIHRIGCGGGWVSHLISHFCYAKEKNGENLDL